MEFKGLAIGFFCMFESTEKIILSYVLLRKLEYKIFDTEILQAAKGENNF